MDSVQKSSEIRNYCTEFLLFAYLAKIKHFYKTKSPAFFILLFGKIQILFKLIGKLNVVFHMSRAALNASILE